MKAETRRLRRALQEVYARIDGSGTDADVLRSVRRIVGDALREPRTETDKGARS